MEILTVKEQRVYNSIVEDYYKKLPISLINEYLPIVVKSICRGLPIQYKKNYINKLIEHKILHITNKRRVYTIDIKYAINYYNC